MEHARVMHIISLSILTHRTMSHVEILIITLHLSEHFLQSFLYVDTIENMKLLIIT